MTELLQPASPDAAQNAESKLASLRASKEYAAATSQEAGKSQLALVTSETAPALPQRVPVAEIPARNPVVESVSPVEQAGEDGPLGAHVDTTVAVDGDPRASEYGGAHRAGTHVDSSVEVDSPSRAPEFAGEHRAGQHVSDAEITSDSEVQTGGEHLAQVEAEVTPSLSLRRKLGAAIKHLFKK